jgi:hypothetical protein
VKWYPKSQIVYLANYVMTLAAMTDHSRALKCLAVHQQINHYTEAHMNESIYLTGYVMDFCANVEVYYGITAHSCVAKTLDSIYIP